LPSFPQPTRLTASTTRNLISLVDAHTLVVSVAETVIKCTPSEKHEKFTPVFDS
jgi:hypothetical protein